MQEEPTRERTRTVINGVPLLVGWHFGHYRVQPKYISPDLIHLTPVDANNPPRCNYCYGNVADYTYNVSKAPVCVVCIARREGMEVFELIVP